MRTSGRGSSITTVTAAFLLIGALFASSASALVREGAGSDAAGDSAGGANRDLTAATFRYDSNGQVQASATMAAPIDPVGGDAFISFTIATGNADGSCSGASISLFGFFSGPDGLAIVSGLSGTGTATKVIVGATISFTFSNGLIANRDYTCATATLGNRTGTVPEFHDVLVPNLFAAGFGPDRDADGKPDNVDACPDQPAATVNGCLVDSDSDGKPDISDACPQQAAATTDGCPAPTSSPAVPSLAGLRISPALFRAALTGSSVRASAGSTGGRVTYSLSVPARVRFTVERRRVGRRVGGRCVQLTPSNRRRAPCTRYVRAPGSFTRARGAGADRFYFTGRLGALRLRPGSYRLVASPTTDGRAGAAKRAAFRVRP